MSLKVGYISYVNVLPLFMGIEKKEVTCSAQLSKACPVELNTMITQGQLDISMMSSSAFLDQKDSLELLSSFCISAQGAADSVRLYHKVPIRDLSHQELALSPESASSNDLCRVLCRELWHIDPNFQERDFARPLEAYTAFILIGDPCLRHLEYPGYASIDLAEAWSELTDLPFTFAVFAGHKETVKAKDNAIQDFFKDLKASEDWGKRNWNALCASAAEETGVSLDRIHHYYKIIQFQFASRERAALERFDQFRNSLTASIT